MLKPILLSSALLFAIPALAQTTNGGQNSGTATTTNDHDPTMEEGDATAAGQTTVGTQANGGVRSSTRNAGTAAQGTSAQGHSGMNHGTMNHGTTGQGTGTAGGTMSGGTMSGGTMSGGSMSGGTGTMSNATGGAYTGVGGPAQGAGTYPPCSRTRTDSCIQTNERGRRR